MEQERIAISDISDLVSKSLSMKDWLQ